MSALDYIVTASFFSNESGLDAPATSGGSKSAV